MSKPMFISTDSSYKPIFRHVEEAADAGMVEKICQEANEAYEQLFQAHADLNSAAMVHWKQCCERAAIYRTLKKYYPETTMEWLNEALREYGIHTGASLNRLLNHRIMKALFLQVMRMAAKTAFGPKGGFKNQFGVMNKQEANFDILECPYCKYLQELGCPELGPGFCKSDEYVYGNLDAFAFERTQTLATGGEKCDFCLRKR